MALIRGEVLGYDKETGTNEKVVVVIVVVLVGDCGSCGDKQEKKLPGKLAQLNLLRLSHTDRVKVAFYLILRPRSRESFQDIRNLRLKTAAIRMYRLRLVKICSLPFDLREL
jgi:5,10-methylenetetrahydrofolate reductase